MTPLILLPGMMCDARLFGPQIEALGVDRDVIVMDLKGDTVAKVAAGILEQAPAQFALAGLSMGGIVAMEILRQAPERIERIALLDTNPLAETSYVRDRREPQIAKVQNGNLIDVMRDEMKPNYLTEGPDRDRILALCIDMAQTLGPDVFVDQSRALQSRPDQSQTLKNSNVPGLILCGRDDRLCPPARHELMHEFMPHAAFEIIENAGHLPTLEQPQQTTAALARWLEAP